MMEKRNEALHLEHFSLSLPDGRPILEDINLSIQQGECHVIMGPNGAGKSSLMHGIMGLDPFIQQSGHIYCQGSSMDSMPVEERAALGLFMSFQSPVAIPGLSNIAFYKAIIQQQRFGRGLEHVAVKDIMAVINEAAERVGLSKDFLRRAVNEDFSGGERKRNELLQMLLLSPSVVMLDEVDSGVDIDAMANFTQLIQEKRHKDNTSFLLITHYHKFLDTVDADAIHVIVQGKKRATGGKELIQEIEKNGFKAWIQ